MPAEAAAAAAFFPPPPSPPFLPFFLFSHPAPRPSLIVRLTDVVVMYCLKLRRRAALPPASASSSLLFSPAAAAAAAAVVGCNAAIYVLYTTLRKFD